MLLAVNLIAIISNWYLFNLSGADWKLHLHGRVFYEGNCHEGKLKCFFFSIIYNNELYSSSHNLLLSLQHCTLRNNTHWFLL